MFQVTVIFQGAEIGYGEGESLEWAKSEAIESCPELYQAIIEVCELSIIEN